MKSNCTTEEEHVPSIKATSLLRVLLHLKMGIFLFVLYFFFSDVTLAVNAVKEIPEKLKHLLH